MFKVDGKATIPNQHVPRLAWRLCNKQQQKLPRLSWKNLALLIVFTSSSAVWFSIGNLASSAAMTKVALAEALRLDPKMPSKFTPHPSANFNPVPTPELEPRLTKNGRNTLHSNEKLQLELQSPEFSLPSLEIQSPLTVERLDEPQVDGDPELGTLRVREIPVQPTGSDNTSELGTLRVREIPVQPTRSDNTSELGTLRVREQDLQPPKQELTFPRPRSRSAVHLLAQVGYFQTNNIFSGVDPVDGGLISSGLTVWGTPALGSKTNLVTAIDGSLIHYIDQSESNYNQLRLRAGIRQQLTPRMYGEIGWINQKLFRAGEGDRFLNEHSLRLALYRRDPLAQRLWLNTFYEFRLSNADPDIRSRIINSLSVSLSYYIQKNLQVGLGYQFGLSDFTQRDREDEYHRLLGRLSYAVSRDSQINVQSGFTFGSSSDPNIDFDNFFFSLTYTVELGEF